MNKEQVLQIIGTLEFLKQYLITNKESLHDELVIQYLYAAIEQLDEQKDLVDALIKRTSEEG